MAYPDENLITCGKHNISRLSQDLTLVVRYVDEAQDNLMIDALCKQEFYYRH